MGGSSIVFSLKGDYLMAIYESSPYFFNFNGFLKYIYKNFKKLNSMLTNPHMDFESTIMMTTVLGFPVLSRSN